MDAMIFFPVRRGAKAPNRLERLAILGDLLAAARRLGRQHAKWMVAMGELQQQAAEAGVGWSDGLRRQCTTEWSEGWRQEEGNQQ